MNKEYYSLGLMSGTSLDGIDASIILSDGENKLEIIDNYYEKYDDKFKLELRKFINQATSIDFIPRLFRVLLSSTTVVIFPQAQSVPNTAITGTFTSDI